MKLNALGVGERYHSYLRRIFERIVSDALNTDPSLALSILTKVLDDTAGPFGLSPTLLVFFIVPRLPINPKELPKQVKQTKAMKAVQVEMASAIAIDRFKTALVRSIPAVADSETVEGFEVFMFHENPIGKWMGPYIVNRRDGKMLILDTRNRFLDASIDWFKLQLFEQQFS